MLFALAGWLSVRYWRTFSDTILQWSDGEHLAAFVYDVGAEQMAGTGDPRRVLWMGSALFTRWHLGGPWSVGVRPELYWDPDGRMTGAWRFIKAVTTTLECRQVFGKTALALRTEYRYDNSTGKEGGFFDPKTGGAPLIAGQNTFFFAALWSFEAF
jgi:hypothetical protein